MANQFLAHYPFTSEAKNFVAEQKIDLNYDLLEISKARVISALKDGQIPSMDTQVEEALKLEICSYAVSRMLVSLLKSKFYVSRYSIAEAKRASSYLKVDSDENLAKVTREFNIGWNKGSMQVSDYLAYAPRALEYKLINKHLSNGLVSLTRNEFIRVIEEAIRKHIESSLPINEQAIPSQVQALVAEVKKALPQETAKITIQPQKGEYAPCIKKLLEDLKNSENLPHIARWSLAVYLIHKGVDVDSIVNLFKTAPDFNEKVTRYQVEYVKKRGYKMPNCSVIMSYGLCVARCRIKNPLEFK
ncbi:hypothetical protein HY570_01330 [Candidatus Micrarchaeota archaeon]|nr:hypothetical protein [Candidatus Micrarchaeota archaeon]